MDATLHLLGLTIDEQTATSAMTDAAAEAVHAQFAADNPDAGLFILATCARLEFIIEAPDRHTERLHNALAASIGVSPITLACPARTALRYELAHDDVVAHLFRVASGLESPILGDTQILTQIRSAETRARAAETLTPRLGEAIRRALATGRAARRETTIGAGSADIGGTVARTIALRGLTFSPVVVVGGGDAAERTLAAFDHAPRSVGVLSSAQEDDHDLAARYGADVVGDDELDRWDDAVFVLTTPDVPDDLSPFLAGARLVVDLVPGGASRYADIERRDLGDWSDPRRLAAIEAVTDLCDDEVADWTAWCTRQPFEDAVGTLYQDLDRLIDDLEVGDAAIAVRSVVRRWLHPHIAALRTAVPAAAPPVPVIQESV
ncbi:MAG: hypothetical protein AAGC53_11290 [Actinomycetota bacterium]